MLSTIFIIIIIFIFALLLFLLISDSYNKEVNIYNNGIETNSIVIRVEPNGISGDRHYHSFVEYMDENGEKHEGMLNVRSNFPIGRKIKIKYISGKFKNVVFVSQDLDTPN